MVQVPITDPDLKKRFIEFRVVNKNWVAVFKELPMGENSIGEIYETLSSLSRPAQTPPEHLYPQAKL
tara:strand:- start:464 stop:664 length:201 start_codon:yes stop_codon:yes gene_type:complete